MLDEKTVAVAKMAAKPKTKNMGIYSISIFSLIILDSNLSQIRLNVNLVTVFPMNIFASHQENYLVNSRKKFYFDIRIIQTEGELWNFNLLARQKR